MLLSDLNTIQCSSVTLFALTLLHYRTENTLSPNFWSTHCRCINIISKIVHCNSIITQTPEKYCLHSKIQIFQYIVAPSSIIQVVQVALFI